MTGFGAGEVALAGCTLRVELRAVNHRHLDVRARVPGELSELGNVLEELVRARCVRGRVEAQATFRGKTSGSGELDLERARRAYQTLLRLRDELAPGEPVAIAAVLSVPGLFASSPALGDDAEAALRRASQLALRDLTAMRAREGQALAHDIVSRLSLVRDHGQAIAQMRPAVVEAAQRRLLKRLDKLLEGNPVALDPNRVAQEVAWFAEKSDVAEELTRLFSHIDEFERSLAGSGEPVGRKLEFLVQEIGRELNTLGAKANDAEISRRVVDMKTELERIREQVQNIL
jgi:uncharacterized protein (TIGR00255 family)